MQVAPCGDEVVDRELKDCGNDVPSKEFQSLGSGANMPPDGEYDSTELDLMF